MVKFMLRTLSLLNFKERLILSLCILTYLLFITYLFYYLQRYHLMFIFLFKFMQIANSLIGITLGFWTFNKGGKNETN